MGPFDRRAERLLPRIDAPPRPQQVQAVREAVEKLCRREQSSTSSSELHGKRQLLEPRAELGRCLVRLEIGLDSPGSGDKERRRIGGLERRHRVRLLSGETEELAARHEQAEVRTGSTQPFEVVRCGDDVLEVVQ